MFFINMHDWPDGGRGVPEGFWNDRTRQRKRGVTIGVGYSDAARRDEME